jgi:hypothetical protein
MFFIVMDMYRYGENDSHCNVKISHRTVNPPTNYHAVGWEIDLMNQNIVFPGFRKNKFGKGIFGGIFRSS